MLKTGYEDYSGVFFVKVCEYLSVCRAYGLVRQTTPATSRVTFDELGILCHLANVNGPLRTSQIAEYQGVLRPTMTHRTGHLAELGLIERKPGERDRRNVYCHLSSTGVVAIRRMVADVCRNIKTDMPLGRCTDERMMRIIDGAAQISFSSADLVLMQLAFCSDDGDGQGSVGGLVDGLGLLQPTVSMAVSSLKRAGYIERGDTPGQAALSIAITESGRARAEKLVAQVAEFRPARARARKSSVL